MSNLLMPILAIGGVVILGDYLTKKNKKDNDSSASASASASGKSIKRQAKRDKSMKTASILKVNKTKKKEDDGKKKMYVFYKTGPKRGKKWRYHKLPKGWVLKKKTNIIHGVYSKEIEFEGPVSQRDEMTKYLEKAFEFLKKSELIRTYKISKETI